MGNFNWKPRIVNGVTFAALFGLWYAISSLSLIDPIFLPSPIKVAHAFLELLSPHFLTEHFLPSFFRVSFAFLISIAIAFPLGIMSSQFQLVTRIIDPLCGFARYLPVAALVPLCILWFGIDNGQKVAVITIGIVFQLVLLFAADTALVPGELIETGRTFGLTKAQIIRRIVLPWAMPAIWEDLRISAGWAWSYLILSELVAGNSGIGYFVVQSQRYLETANVFAGILFIGLLGLLTDLIFRMAGARLFRWL
jgi:NitT/TauT family transport system permease protein